MEARLNSRYLRRAAGWRDVVSIALLIGLFYPLYEELRRRPRLRRLLSCRPLVAVVQAIFGRLWCIRLRHGDAVARLVFVPLEYQEFMVIDELLYHPLYLVDGKYEVFIDCGAFRGISTIYLQDQAHATTILAFEPEARNFADLQRRLAITLPQAVCVRAAVGVQDGLVRFSGGGVGGKVDVQGEEVKQIELAALAELRNAASLLLKMDIEGGEVEILPTLRKHLPHRCGIWLETHCSEAKARELLEPYETDGFVVSKLREREAMQAGDRFIEWWLRRTDNDPHLHPN